MTSPNKTGADLQGWIDEPWAIRGQSRSVFFQNILTRFCPALMNPLLARANESLITIGFDFWSDRGTTNSIYRAFSMLIGWDWGLIGFIASQDAVFIQRLTAQSAHEYNRARQFMEQFSDFCNYRNLKMGSQSRLYEVNNDSFKVYDYSHTFVPSIN